MTAPAVRARGLRRRYGAVEALAGLDLEVSCGQSLLISGDNGSGKTTLLRLLAGLGSPSAGSLEVLGAEGPPAAELRARIGMLAHETWLYPDLSAADNLNYFSRLYGGKGAGSSELAAVGLDPDDDRPVRNYSRGMAQLLSLARAMVHAPELLLLDEPFTGLDREALARVRSLLDELKRTGRTVIMATHDIEKAEGWADRAALMRRGRLVWDSGDSRPDSTAILAAWDRTHREGG